MDITISMLNGTSHTLRVHPGDTVGSLKILIQEKLGVLVATQKLVFVNGMNTDLSDDSRPLSSYGLQHGARVSLLVTQPVTPLVTQPVTPLVTPPATIQVFLRNEKGTISTYDIKPDETVSHFKTKVQSREGVPVSQQRLIHQGREMTDGRRLSDYNVGALSTIDMTFRLRGG
ncbi:ubiquitin-like protein ISG15 isoform X1 [Etheostoma cragini]|uniref:ubiquitin-like protein ISG15 isoform X1 n=1 Tax=Etheostoma cragini TaxID=417921 RepID=UPI00155EE184|nr:ubiquitin-like protein ISG15 isoform X1 [Etheostoma cragini]